MRSSFGGSVSYGSRFWGECLRQNTYTGTIRGKGENITLIQGPVLKSDKKIHYKIYYFNVIPQIFVENNINNITIKTSCYPRRINPSFLNFALKVIMNHYMFMINM